MCPERRFWLADVLWFGVAGAAFCHVFSLAGCAPDLTVTTTGSGGSAGTGGAGGSTTGPSGGAPGGEPVWAVPFSGTGDAEPRTLASAGDTLVVGIEFTGALTASGLASEGGSDIAIARLSSAGTLVGVSRYGDANPQEVHGAAPDGADGFYLAGTFSGEIGEDMKTAQAKGLDGFVARVDTLGGLSWILPIGGAGSDGCRAVAQRPGGGVAIAGTFTGEVDFGDIELASAGGDEVFVTTLSADGGSLATIRLGDAFSQRAAGIGVDSEGNTTVLYDSEGPGGLFDIGVSQIDSAGQPRWEKVIATAGDDRAAAMAVDGPGNVLVAGHKDGGLDLGDGVVGSPAFVALYDRDGELAYARGIDGSPDLRIRAVALDANGNALLAGAFTGTLSAGGQSADSHGALDAFVIKLDPSGGVMWIRAFGDEADQSATAIMAAPMGKIAFVGWFEGSPSFGATELGPASGKDGFIAVLDP